MLGQGNLTEGNRSPTVRAIMSVPLNRDLSNDKYRVHKGQTP